MGIYKEVDSSNNGLIETWDNNNQIQYFSIFEPEYFGEKEKDLSFIKNRIYQQVKWYYGNELGFALHQPPSVSGWPAFYQDPVYDLFWLNSSTLPRRINAVNDILRWGAWLDVTYDHGGGAKRRLNVATYFKSFENPKSINLFIDELIFRFLGGEPSNSLRQKISQALLNDINEDHWSDEVSKLIDQEVPDRNIYSSMEWRLGNAFEVLGTTGEFHLF